MEQFPSNSKTGRETEKEDPKDIKQVTVGKVIVRKPSLGKRFIRTFISGDGHSVGQYVLMEILVPAFKDLISDIVSQGVEKMVYGDARSTSRRTGQRPVGGGTYVAYNRPDSTPPWRRGSSRESSRPDISRRARASHDFKEIVLNTRPEANEVLDQMYALFDKFGQVTVSDLYELVGLSSNFTDEKYGWTNLHGSDVQRVRDGYLLDLPKPIVLE